MVVNPKDRSSRIEAQIISMRQFHFPQIDIKRLSIFKRYEHRGHVLLQFISLNIFYCQIFIQQWGWVTSSHNLSYDPSPTI